MRENNSLGSELLPHSRVEILGKIEKKIFFTHIESPSKIFIRDEKLEKLWNTKFLHEIQDGIVQNFHHRFKSNVKIEDLINNFVIVEHKKLYHRGKVLTASMENSTITCQLIDYGKIIENVNIDAIRPVSKDLKNLHGFCVCVNLDEILPTGSTDPTKWTNTSKDRFLQITRDHEIFMQQTGKSVQDENNMMKTPVNLYFLEKLKERAFEPTTFSLQNVKEVLIDQGLALRPRK